MAAAALLAGAVYLLLAPAALTGYLASPRLLALTHLFTLGFVSLVFLGTLQQLPAVMLVTDLAWPRLGVLSLPVAVIGIGLLVFGFASGIDAALLASGGTLVTLALGLALAQLIATAAKRPPRDPAGRGLVTAVAYLFLTVLAGLLLASARASPAFAAAVGYSASLHQTLGLMGAFLLGIAAAGHKLLSMFALSKGGPSWRLKWLTWAVHVAVATTLVRAFGPLLAAEVRQYDALLGQLATAGLVAAAGLQLWEVKSILERRLRKRLEAPIVRYVLAHAFLPLAGLLLLLGYRSAATLLFMLGFVGLAVSGMLVKILSFLTWTSVYARRSNKVAAPPLLRELMIARLEPVTTAGLAAGALLAGLAVISASQPLAVLAAIGLVVGATSQLAQVIVIVYRTLFGTGHSAAAAPPRPPLASGPAAGTTPGPRHG